MIRARYFAFGSNMLSARLLARTGSAVPRGLARLPGWRRLALPEGRLQQEDIHQRS